VKVCYLCGSSRCDVDWTCADCHGSPAQLDGFFAFAPELATENAGFQESYFAELAALEASNFWFRARNDLIIWAMQTYVPDCQRFLEIGCGTGFVLSGIRAAFPSADLVGSEIFSAGLAFAAQRVPSAVFYQVDARHIPFRDDFDAIGAFDVLEHIDDDVAVIEEVARALRPEGRFVISVPQHPALWSPQDDHAYHVRRYTSAGLRRKLEGAGFEVIRMTSFVSLLLPLMLVSRLRLRVRPSDPAFDAIDELRLSPAANAIFGSIMRIEGSLTRRGVSWPAGGSLLVVARKRSEGEVRR
jgi:SAM-dependent methyltransferase